MLPSKNKIISSHPDAPAHKDDDVHGKKHIQLNPEMLETSCGNPGGTVRCCRFQQSQAKGQFRRPHAALFKSLLNLKLAKDTIVRLHIIVLPSYELRVLSRSFNNNQNKTLCFL
jgi:hypothetical protein